MLIVLHTEPNDQFVLLLFVQPGCNVNPEDIVVSLDVVKVVVVAVLEDYTQCVKSILNKIAKMFNNAYLCRIEKFQLYFFKNSICKGMESTSQAVWPIWQYLG